MFFFVYLSQNTGFNLSVADYLYPILKREAMAVISFYFKCHLSKNPEGKLRTTHKEKSQSDTHHRNFAGQMVGKNYFIFVLIED